MGEKDATLSSSEVMENDGLGEVGGVGRWKEDGSKVTSGGRPLEATW